MKIKKQKFIAVAIALSLTACNEDSAIDDKKIEKVEYVTVTAKNGATVTGKVESGESVESFKGIQYATSERFEHSEMQALAGSIDATEFGAICPQLGEKAGQQSEDCLFLNIWRPQGIEAGENLPVYVFIHGGSFETGAGSTLVNHGDTIVSQGAEDNNRFISVSINYRVGLLGSLWTNDDKGGNYGIGDQKKALEWVNENIADFGGNPADVTVFGESAGAMSIGILQQETPKPEASVAGKYYQRAIMQSNPYGLAYKNYDSAEKLQQTLRQYVADEPKFEGKTLEQLSLEQIKDVQAYAKSGAVLLDSLLKFAPATSGMLPFAPYIEQKKNIWGNVVVEGYHLTEQPVDTQFSVPTVIGFNTDESNIFTSMLEALLFVNIEDNDGKYVIDHPAIPDLVRNNNMYDLSVRAFYGFNGVLKAQKLLGMENYQPEDDSTLEGSSNNVAKFRMLANDMLFTCASRKVVQNQADNNNGSNLTTMYHFDYAPSFNFWPLSVSPLTSLSCLNKDGSGKACHAAELPFVFNKAVDIASQKVYTTKADRALMDSMSRQWFKADTFTGTEMVTSRDNAVMINSGGFNSIDSWDDTMNDSRCKDVSDLLL
ncbi:carboxylesterase family protein [Photobacterium sp. SDRW27]|uniref:carboxylesterase family protein n=1 Tax=Photobacterium obscurum TaxID=2829490 RepID=UPI00224374CE|nr:carboxylesterase family protein [Photobacterium obscurum]MCW8331223.1 carboxylesterase family protein [Photobacterium obscurum]